MQKVIFDVMDETVMKVAKQVKNSKPDSMLLLAPVSGNCSLHAPSKTGKYKGYHRIKMEVWIPEDAIKGENVLDDISLITLLRLPKSRVQPHLIRNEGE